MIKTMNRVFAVATLWLVAAVAAFANAPEPDFDACFEDATLRLDYVFCGDNAHQQVFFQ